MEIRPECQHYSWKIVKLEARARTWVALAAEGGERKGIIRRRGYPSLISGERASGGASIRLLARARGRCHTSEVGVMVMAVSGTVSSPQDLPCPTNTLRQMGGTSISMHKEGMKDVATNPISTSGSHLGRHIEL